jgi:hypothetical protein
MSEPYLFSKYTILSNPPEFTGETGGIMEIHYPLPHWFTSWKKRKIIKIYGCSWAYLDSEDLKPIPSTKYANQFVTVHSNIARDAIQNIPGLWHEGNIPTQDQLDAFTNCLMVVNNYYTPKIIDVSDAEFHEIVIWFKVGTGAQIAIRSSHYSSCGNGKIENEQAVFKIECELAILDA